MHHGDAGPKAADSASVVQGTTTSGRTTNGIAAPSASGSDTDDFHNRLLVEVGSLNPSQHALLARRAEGLCTARFCLFIHLVVC